MAEPNQSALLLLELIQQEREKQRAHFDALDNKAGLVVGFAALLVTLLPELVLPVRAVALATAAGAGAWGLAAFWPRRYRCCRPVACASISLRTSNSPAKS